MNTLENILTRSPERLAIAQAIKSMYKNPLKFKIILDNFTNTANYILMGVFEDIFERIISEALWKNEFVIIFQKEHKYFSKHLTPDYYQHTLEILQKDDIWYNFWKTRPDE
jgi:hypothetical protein